MDVKRFVRERLRLLGYDILPLDERAMRARLGDVMALVNGVRREHSALYGWSDEEESYFLNPMVRKWEFSFCIVRRSDDRIVFVGMTSVYGQTLHLHSQFAARECRGQGIGKLHLVYLCDTACEAGFEQIEAYTPKHNSAAVVFFLSTGWRIEDIRKNGSQLLLVGLTKSIRDTTLALLAAHDESSDSH